MGERRSKNEAGRGVTRRKRRYREERRNRADRSNRREGGEVDKTVQKNRLSKEVEREREREVSRWG